MASSFQPECLAKQGPTGRNSSGSLTSLIDPSEPD
jgi:hypothetical protein